MRRVSLVFALALAPVASVSPDARAASPPTPIDALGADLGEAFTGVNLIFYGAAITGTGAMALSGGDHAVRVLAQRHFGAPAWGDAAFVVGYTLPEVVAAAIWASGLATKRTWALGAGSAALQALGVTVVTTALLKGSTGRPYPLHGGDPRAPDVLDHPSYAREFSPFNTRGDWAWPSGHTSAITSVVAALSAWDPEHLAIPLIGYPLATAVGLGMIDGDRHWTSDVIAGGLIGYAIGSSVGASFRRRARGEAEDTAALRIVPLGAGSMGIAVIGGW